MVKMEMLYVCMCIYNFCIIIFKNSKKRKILNRSNSITLDPELFLFIVIRLLVQGNIKAKSQPYSNLGLMPEVYCCLTASFQIESSWLVVWSSFTFLNTSCGEGQSAPVEFPCLNGHLWWGITVELTLYYN